MAMSDRRYLLARLDLARRHRERPRRYDGRQLVWRAYTPGVTCGMVSAVCCAMLRSVRCRVSSCRCSVSTRLLRSSNVAVSASVITSPQAGAVRGKLVFEPVEARLRCLDAGG
jgi:hypothetical protein